MTACIRRREFITLLGGAAAAWPLAARAQQAAIPVVGFIRDGSADTAARYVAAFRKGLNETGYVEGQNVTVEYHWLEGRYDRLPALLADLARRQVAVIATPGQVPAIAAKAAITTVPIVFGVGDDPVKLGLVASLARPDGNATGINFFVQEVAAKRLRLLHDLIPNAVRIAVLVNPVNAAVETTTLREVQEAAPVLGLQIQVLKASGEKLQLPNPADALGSYGPTPPSITGRSHRCQSLTRCRDNRRDAFRRASVSSARPGARRPRQAGLSLTYSRAGPRCGQSRHLTP
jgi:putative ABC transport system substrate-binding protein